MTDLESGYGEFKGWPQERKRALIQAVTEIVRRYAKHAVSGLVIAQDYEEAIPLWAKDTAAFGDAYNFCFQMCIGQSMDYVQSLQPPMPKGENISFMFEQQKKHEGITRNNYSRIKEFRDHEDRMGAFGFGAKREFVPLQVADFFVYESYKELDNRVRQSGRGIRAPLKILQDNGQSIQAHYFGKARLEELIRYYEKAGRSLKGDEPWWPFWRGKPVNA